MFKDFLTLLVGALFLAHFTVADLDPEKKELIETGLGAVSQIAVKLDGSAEGFPETLRASNIETLLGPFLEALRPMVDQVFKFVNSQDDPVTREIRREFIQVNSKLDRISDRLDNEESNVAWHVEYSRYQTYAHTVKRFKNKIIELSQSNVPKEKQDQILQEYRSGYDDAGEKLKDMLLGEDSTSIINRYKSYTNKHRKKVSQFMMLSMVYLIEASLVEVVYMEFEKSDDYINDEIDHWKEFIRKVKREMLDVDRTFTYSDAQADAQCWVRENRHLSAQALTNKVRQDLEDKYYWRKWLVITYWRSIAWSVRTRVTPGVVEWIHNDGDQRGVRIVSVPRNRRFSSYTAQRTLNSYKNSRNYNDGKRKKCGLWGRRARRCALEDSQCNRRGTSNPPSDLVAHEIRSQVTGEAYVFVVKECAHLCPSYTPGSYANAFWTHRCWSGDCDKWHAIVFG